MKLTNNFTICFSIDAGCYSTTNKIHFSIIFNLKIYSPTIQLFKKNSNNQVRKSLFNIKLKIINQLLQFLIFTSIAKNKKTYFILNH